MTLSKRIRVAIVSAMAVILVALFAVAPSVWAQSSNVSIGVGDTTFTIQGYTSPGAQVTIIDGGSVIGSVAADSTGSYSQHFTAQPAGIHNLQVYAKDRAGLSTGTATQQVNITEHAETTVNVFLSPTVQMSQTTLRQGTPLVLAGEGTPGATLILHVDNTILTTTIDGDGYWRYSLPTASLVVGQHQLFVAQQQSNGSQSFSTPARLFFVSAVVSPIAIPILGTGYDTPGVPIILQPTSGSFIASRSVVVAGVAEPGVRVEVWNNGALRGASFADSNGNWQLSIPLTASTNNLKARACDGRLCGDFSNTVTVFLQAQFAEYLQLLLVNYSYEISTSEMATLEARISYGKPPYTFTIEWGDGGKTTISTSKNESIFKHRYYTPGKYKGAIIVTDAKKQSVTLKFAATVTPTWMAAWAVFGIVLIFAIIALMIRRKHVAKH